MSDRELLQRVLTHLEKAQAVANLGSWEGLGADEPLYLSPQAYEIMGWPRDRRPSFAAFLEATHPDDRARFLAMRRDALAGWSPYELDLRILRPDGETRHVHLAARIERDDSGASRRFIGTVQDRTTEVRSRQRLDDAERARLELLHQALLAVERERAALAAALERGAGAAIPSLIEEIEARVADGLLPQEAGAATTALRSAQDSLRRLVSSMGPTVSTDVDLRTALGALAEATVPDIHVKLDAGQTAAVPDDLQRIILQIANEALHNVRKHSEASEVRIDITAVDGAVVLEVIDDGRGFDPDRISPEPGHLGLTAMRERAELANGSLRITSQPGRTAVRAVVPVG